MKNNFKTILLYLVFAVMAITAVTTMLNGTRKDEPVFSDIYDLFVNEQVRSFVITQDAELVMKVRSDTEPDNEAKDKTVSSAFWIMKCSASRYLKSTCSVRTVSTHAV